MLMAQLQSSFRLVLLSEIMYEEWCRTEKRQQHDSSLLDFNHGGEECHAHS
ncbi:hypothetical protein ACHAXN_012364 [Cyclotella atomus]